MSTQENNQEKSNLTEEELRQETEQANSDTVDNQFDAAASQDSIPNNEGDPEEADSLDPEKKQYVDQIIKLNEEKSFYEDKYSRLAAEFENFKRRNRQELETKVKFAGIPLVESILPSLDNLRRALDHAKKDVTDVEDEFLKGIEMVFNQLHTSLENVGVKKVDSLGVPFDPNCHEAMGAIETDRYQENHVAEVFRDGYSFHERLIRPAMVQISKAPSNSN